jgi:glutathione S-transferase
VLTLEGCSIGDSRVIAAIEERWPQPALYPEDQARRCRALDLEDFFDEELGPHIRRAMYHELLPRPELLLPLFSHGQPPSERTLLQARFTALRASMGRRMDIRPETAALSRAKVIAAMDRLKRETAAGGYLVGESFTVADLTAAALFYPVAGPPEFPYPTVAQDDLPDSWREFLDSLAQRPGGQWVSKIYRRHRRRSAELTPGEGERTHRAGGLTHHTTSRTEGVST